jgi:drug/metabolite transporter (DMT)-like permease
MPLPHAGELAALGAALCWTATPLAFEAAGRRIGSLSVNLIRLVIALPLLAAVAWLLRGIALPVDADPRQWLLLSLSGLIGFTFGDLCLFRAFLELGPRLSTVVMASAPLFAVLFGRVLLAERVTAQQGLGILAIVAGVAWAVAERRAGARGGEGRFSWRGLALAGGGALGQAGGLVVSKLGMGDYHFVAATEIRVLAGALGFALLFVPLGHWPRTRAALADRRALVLCTIGAGLGPVVGVSLSLYAVQHAPAGVAASLMATTPIWILPVAVLFGYERVGVGGAFGALLAVGGVGLLFL